MAAVHPALRAYVRSLQVYDLAHASPGVHIGMPSTELTWVLPLDEPLDVSWADEPAGRAATWASVSGLHTRPATIHHGLHQRGIQLALTPAGARALWGVPASALAGHLLELGDVSPDLPPDLAALAERVAAATTWRDRVALVEQTLLHVLARRPATEARPEAWVRREFPDVQATARPAARG